MEIYKCCLCGKNFRGFGNNPWPLSKKENDRCCDECNDLVIIARIKGYKDLDEFMKKEVGLVK